jgi:hypothetical protein
MPYIGLPGFTMVTEQGLKRSTIHADQDELYKLNPGSIYETENLIQNQLAQLLNSCQPGSVLNARIKGLCWPSSQSCSNFYRPWHGYFAPGHRSSHTSAAAAVCALLAWLTLLSNLRIPESFTPMVWQPAELFPSSPFSG